MATIDCKDPMLSDAVDEYVRARKQGGRPISIREAVEALRTVRIKCYGTDRELSEMVAERAIWHGQVVIFDWTGTED